MSPTKLKTILSPLAVEYQEMKKQAARGSERTGTPAPPRSAVTPEPEDRVTLSTCQQEESDDRVTRTVSQPVSNEERQALMLEFSIRV